ncbi:unnamed protein product [Prunus armeniaca]
MLRDLARAYKELSHSPYCQLVLGWNLNFLHGIRARLHLLGPTATRAPTPPNMCCPRIRLESSPRVRLDFAGVSKMFPSYTRCFTDNPKSD